MIVRYMCSDMKTEMQKVFKEVYILRQSERKNKDKYRVVILLLLKADKGNQHYTLVKKYQQTIKPINIKKS